MRAINLQSDPCELRDVYGVESGYLYSVCYLSDSDTLLVCLDKKHTRWLVALCRSENEWHETHRVEVSELMLKISCALNNSQMLIGAFDSNYMELYRVDTNRHIARVNRIVIKEPYIYFSATCGSDTLVAMTYSSDKSVRVHRLRGDRLELVTRLKMNEPKYLLWYSERLLVAEGENQDTVTELELIGERLKRTREFISPEEHTEVRRWCAIDNGVAIFNQTTGEIVLYTE